ncbi:MAG: type II toxin-antitoxin system MqsR family toxin [Gallionellaceae bacterium]|nr:type II toxin-antitoxin system MqsR family toxin [Gallionellaceae bacterium]
MEKFKAHYSLQEIQTIVAHDGSQSFTFAAQQGAQGMGLSRTEALGVVLALTNTMVYKSMTTHSDNKVWQDVYHSPCPNGKIAYIKLTMRDGAVVIQFKEK